MTSTNDKPRKRRAKAERPYAKLIIYEGGREERTIELSARSTTIGRSHENTIEIDDINSSRRHCEIVRRDGVYEVVDLKSRNGTLVNGILVLRKELRPGDCIEVGKTRMYFEHVAADRTEDTIDLTTDRFLVPLDELDVNDPLEVLKKERTIFLKLLDFTRQLNSKVTVGDLHDYIIDTIVEVSGAERGFLILIGSNGLVVAAARNMDREPIRSPESKISLDIVRQTIESGAAMLLSEADAFALTSSGESGDGEPLGVRSVLCVPVVTGNAPLGALWVDHRFEGSAFTDDHRRWLGLVANQVSVALRTARLFEEGVEKQKELERAQQSLEKLNVDLEEKVLSKSLQLEEVIKLIPRERPRDFKYDYTSIITRSPKMFDIFRLLDKVTDSAVPVLVLGESGTGKELIARAIHQNGPRAEKEFVSENCAAIPVNLMESEFFGHVRGAFTGATRDKRGLFEVADGGTLFLDEIADMPPSMQTKLLRVLQEGEIRRVGGKDMIRVNVRIISATNKNIYELVRRGEFREDLLYRINVITITLPPLRERREDIPLLIDHFLARIAERTGERKSLDRETFHLLYQYDWPGNIRELENEVERLAALSGDRLEPHLLSPNIQARGMKRGVSWEGSSLKEVVARTVEDV
ncbi:MAG TPA: sigma 54-interacting transcriptional regulator, partial [Planctomycetota bacterium]|nr:sigma 54-interacting transcriptional regulator [Planctomycetota bacterium]